MLKNKYNGSIVTNLLLFLIPLFFILSILGANYIKPDKQYETSGRDTYYAPYDGRFQILSGKNYSLFDQAHKSKIALIYKIERYATIGDSLFITVRDDGNVKNNETWLDIYPTPKHVKLNFKTGAMVVYSNSNLVPEEEKNFFTSSVNFTCMVNHECAVLFSEGEP